MTLRWNLLAGVMSSGVSALATLVAVPFYIRYLGLEAYGLLGLFVTAQAMLSLLDFGASAAMNREVTRTMAASRRHDAGELLHSLARIYWCGAALIALTCAAIAPMVAKHWLAPSHIANDTVRNSLMLIGLAVACRWPISLYLNAILGAQRAAVASLVTVLSSVISVAGAIVIVISYPPRLEAVLLWQAAVGLATAFTMKSLAWRVIGKKRNTKFSMTALRGIWRFSVGVAGITLSSVLLTQVDKVLLSRLLTLSDFGQYALAVTVASGMYLLATPTFNVIYPRFVALVTSNDVESLLRLYRSGTRTLAIIVFPAATLIALFAKDLLGLWTGNSVLASSVSPVVALLCVSAALHSVMYFPYALQLSYGMTGLPMRISTGLLCAALPLVSSLALTYGIVGAAAAQLVLYSLYLVVGSWLTDRHIPIGIGPSWLYRDVGLPLVTFASVGVAGKWLLDVQPTSMHFRLEVAAWLVFGMLLASLAMAPRAGSLMKRPILRSKDPATQDRG